MRRIIFLLSFLTLGASLHAEKLRVLTTFAPIDSLTRSVAGEAAEIQMLLPPGVGPHDFSFSPGDLRAVAAADVIVMNGLGIEEWLKKTVTSSLKPGAVIIDTSTGVKTMESSESEDAHDHHDHDHDHGGINPHIWLDPQRAIQQITNIRDGLVKKDPANATLYQANAEQSIAKLEKLDADIVAAVATFPSKKIITFHDSFPYFAERYGIDIVGVFETFPGKEPSPKYLLQLQKKAKAKGAAALFAEPQYSPKILSLLAEQVKIPVGSLDPLETGEPSATLYESVMRSNLNALQQALGTRPQ